MVVLLPGIRWQQTRTEKLKLEVEIAATSPRSHPLGDSPECHQFAYFGLQQSVLNQSS